jgi:hypothetical protein
MSQFVIEISDSKAASAFLQFIRSLNFVKKVEKISANELDNKILRSGKSIKKKKSKWNQLEEIISPMRKGLPVDYKFDREAANAR